MNILMICTKFSLDSNDGWLTNELAEAYANQGHYVQVILLDWSAKNSKPAIHSFSPNFNVLVLAPAMFNVMGRLVGHLVKWTFSSYLAIRQIKRHLADKKFDLVIGFSPAVITNAVTSFCIRNYKCPAYLILWDFFPLHHQQMGLIKNQFIFQIAYFLEQQAMKKYDAIGCLTEQCVQYLVDNYRLNPKQTIHVLPVWGKAYNNQTHSRLAMRQRYNLPINRNIAIFGGQLVAGRGVDDILAVAKICQQNNDNLSFLIIGTGPYENTIKEAIADSLHNLILLERIPRADYLQLLTACDIGLVCLIADMSAPSFPSKSIDYFRVGLPIVASINKCMDYAAFLQSTGAGLSSMAGDSYEFYLKLKKIVECSNVEREEIGQNGKIYFHKNMEVNIIAKQILTQSNLDGAK